ncbi:MAG: WecB/TagA/CpsF family glycosyltransferase [Bradymonadales bacterium]|nr:WecB/TagA/CpsF family glycosyltransferase [Bradymonadales bacterium]
MTSEPSLPRITLSGLRLHAITMDRCVGHILDEIQQGHGGWVATPNIDHLRRLLRDRSFARLVETASLVVADGMPLLWAARLQGTPLPERVPGSDLIWRLSGAAASRGLSVFLLGGAPGTARAAAEVLRSRYDGLRIAGTCCPEPGFENDPTRMEAIKGALLAAVPDIVFVALGAPKQERLIVELRGLLPGCWWIPVGISFSFVAGEVSRAPKWMQRSGLEWVHRLFQEPRRLARRYLLEDLPFAIPFLWSAALKRCSGNAKEGT